MSEVKGIVYIIRNKNNNKIYVGQTLSHIYNEKTKEWSEFGINGRLLKHLQRVSLDVNYPLYVDIKKYGFQDFEIVIEHLLSDVDALKIDDLEKETIIKYDSIQNGYNLSNNTNSMNISKKQLYEYYKKEIVRSEEHKERNSRRSQLTIAQKDRYNFFENKIIKTVRINPIKEGGIVKTARVIFDIKDDELYRINFTNKNIKEAFERATSFIKEVYTGEIDIHPFFTNSDENNVYHKARELEEVRQKNIIKINGRSYLHKEINNNVYMISIYFSDDNKKKIMFGGKNININNAFIDAQEFINKLNVSKDLCSLSCPQQAAAI